MSELEKLKSNIDRIEDIDALKHRAKQLAEALLNKDISANYKVQLLNGWGPDSWEDWEWNKSLDWCIGYCEAKNGGHRIISPGGFICWPEENYGIFIE